MSKIEKLSGALSLGPSRQERVDTVYEYIRVGGTFLKSVKIPAVLNSLLRNGDAHTLWVATIHTPTPFLFKTKIHVVYAVESGGEIHRAIEDVARGWTTGKWMSAIVMLGLGFLTLPLYIGVLFLITALRIPFATLPLDEMRSEPA